MTTLLRQVLQPRSIDLRNPDTAGTEPTPDDEPRLARTVIGRWEQLAVALVLIAEAAWSIVHTRNWWFVADFWTYAAREGVGGWFDDHGGHLNLFNVAAAKLIRLGGFDYWPIWGSVRVLAWSAMSFCAWWTIRRAGASPLIALAALVCIATFWYNIFVTVILLNIPITLICLCLAGHLAASNRPRALAATLLCGVLAGSTAVLGTLALIAALARRPGHRRLIPWAAAPLVVFGVWYGFAVPSGPERDLLATEDLPATVWSIAEAAVRVYLQDQPVPALVISAVLALLLGRQALRLARQGGVGLHEEFFTLLTALYVLALVWDRVLVGRTGEAPRYAFFFVFFLVMAIAPGLRFERREPLWAGAVLAVVATLAIGQLGARSNAYAFGERTSVYAYPRVRGAVHLLADGADHLTGQTFLPGSRGGGQLSVDDLVRYAEDGWRPEPPPQSILDEVRADLLTLDRLVVAVAPTCVPTTAPIEVDEPATFLIHGAPGEPYVVHWEGRDFAERGATGAIVGPSGVALVQLLAGDNTARIVLEGNAEICRLD